MHRVQCRFRRRKSQPGQCIEQIVPVPLAAGHQAGRVDADFIFMLSAAACLHRKPYWQTCCIAQIPLFGECVEGGKSGPVGAIQTIQPRRQMRERWQVREVRAPVRCQIESSARRARKRRVNSWSPPSMPNKASMARRPMSLRNVGAWRAISSSSISACSG